MIGKIKILAIIFSLVIVGSAATIAMDGDNDGDAECRDSPKTVYVVYLSKVESRYDHEIYLLINSENGEPVCGIVEILSPELKEREGKEEWEKEEGREDEEKESKEEYEDDDKEGEKEEEREEERGENEEEREEDPDEEQEEERERRREEEEDEERENEEDEEREREEECEDDEECEEEREDGCCRCDEDEKECEEKERNKRNPKRKDLRTRSFRFNFKEGKGRFLLFSSSHRSVGTTAIITIRTQAKVKITPFINVKNTDVPIFPDSKDEEGQYCKIEKIKGGFQYYFEDLMDSPEIECDWDYDDVIVYIGQPKNKENLQKNDEKKEQKEKR